MHHTVSYYSSRSLSLFWCMLAALLHCTSARNSNNIDNQAKSQKKRYETGATTIFLLLLHPFDVCLFAPHFRFSLHTFHLTHFRNTSLAFSEPLPSLRSVLFLRPIPKKALFLTQLDYKFTIQSNFEAISFLFLPPRAHHKTMTAECTIN